MRPKSKCKETYANGACKETQKKRDATPKQRRIRALHNKKNRDEKTYGNRDGKDVSHRKNGKTFLEKASKNRARKGRA